MLFATLSLSAHLAQASCKDGSMMAEKAALTDLLEQLPELSGRCAATASEPIVAETNENFDVLIQCSPSPANNTFSYQVELTETRRKSICSVCKVLMDVN